MGHEKHFGIGTARWNWFMRGAMVGVLILGSLNALSFFVRSRGWGSLLGTRLPDDEAIGFPALIWREGGGYGGHEVNYWGWGINLGFAALLASVLGAIAVAKAPLLNRMLEAVATRHQETMSQPLQFSMRSLLVTMVLGAVCAAVARTWTPRWEILAAIYALAPTSLVLGALIPHRIRWQTRVAILAPAAFVLIAVAIGVGRALGIDFDKVLMGIFICWTPQSGFAALGLLAYLFVSEYRMLPKV